MTSYLIDTNTVSYIVSGRSAKARAHLVELAPDEVACLSSITVGEIHYGLARKPDAHKLRMAVENFLSKIRILPWGREEALAYGNLRAALEESRKTLENMDMLIAAHAIATGSVLVTNDKALLKVNRIESKLSWATDVR